MKMINYHHIDAILDTHQRDPLQRLQILIDIQAEYGGISTSVRNYIAKALCASPAEISGLIEFYHFLSPDLLAQYRLYVANNITDRFLGNTVVMDVLLRTLKLRLGQPRADGRVVVEYTSCTGLCDQGPAMLINGRPLTRVTPERAAKIAARINAGEPLDKWPHKWFAVKEPIQVAGPVLSAHNKPGQALHALFTKGPDDFLSELDKAGLRGRGGAGFRTALKWRLCRDALGIAHYVICNADEGEPGTFKDRTLLTRFADTIFEGMTLAGLVVGASKGLLYLRAEYRYLYPKLVAILARRQAKRLLGKQILGKNFSFDIDIHMGAGAYIAGEESALIESLEGKRAIPRIRPPYTATHGYLGQPTVCNNVETFVNATLIACHGATWFTEQGTELSPGTKLLSVSGDVALPGIYEYPFGTPVQTVLDACGASDSLAVQIGGPSGTCITSDEFSRTISFEDLPTGGSFMVFNRRRDMLSIIQNFTHFFSHESCGFCTPCRVGTSLLRQAVDKIVAGRTSSHELADIKELANLIRCTSHCGLGQSAANPFLDTLVRLPALFEKQLCSLDFTPGFDVDGALSTTRALSQRNDQHAHLTQTGENSDDKR